MTDGSLNSPWLSPPTEFQHRLLNWFERHGRTSLPWQNTRDPYAIWVAEIMLQQTRVSTVIPYYQKFMARFPDLATLAHCDADELLHYWAGLGYYARARNLHAAAKKIIAQHAGHFPNQFAQIVALPGIGRSTAAAILVFAWGARHAILDGNVKRVLTRYYAIAGSPANKEVQDKLWKLADQLTPATRVGDYTQALMDLGASVCVPTKPQCASCPLMVHCKAYQRGTPTAFPQAKAKTARPRKSVVMLLVKNTRAEILLVKRAYNGIWGGLWSLPEYTLTAMKPPLTENKVEQKVLENWCEQQFGVTIELATELALPPRKHSFTHFDLDILPLPAVCTSIGESVMDVDPYLWYNLQSPAQVGLPTAVKRILEPLNET